MGYEIISFFDIFLATTSRKWFDRMKEDFEIIEIKQDWMILKAQRQSGCQTCESKSACGTGVLSGFFAGFSQFKKPLQKDAQMGDVITLEIAASELFFRAFQLYLMPLLALFCGAYFSTLLFPANDIVQALMGLGAFALSLIFLRVYLK
ncbi:MAG TPA: Fis family transcriptional regulator [Candidatus Thioglobus sp.]|nr:Fis family transcriptional regulator [Candidatus Thioglobus sp.]